MARHTWSKLKPDDPIFSSQYVVLPIRSERALQCLAEKKAQKEAPDEARLEIAAACPGAESARDGSRTIHGAIGP